MATTVTGDLPHDNLQAQAIGMILPFQLLRLLPSFCGCISVYGRARLPQGETVTSYSLSLPTTPVTVKLKIAVINYNYVGYHIWDVPSDWDSTPGRTALQPRPRPHQDLYPALSSPPDRAEEGCAANDHCLLVLNAIAAVVTFLITTFSCLPVASNWDPNSYPNEKCINLSDFVTGTASVSIFTDFLVLLMPTWIVYNLHIAKKQKIMLIGILSFGLM
ncbi:hypothetical protein AN7179.2 [Aspergillus nidulans FGSC A4]|uniref:Rhodopsin domain-containing protein n=1 Tax=Emericella nidulans (strain FGSC A4 / ATCC 38163 / CBS 112.46 / NRRL 194 / M139) TaxID=227321 RepID=Q5AX01_EMENI|nr:hypothetical protein [Aspergillus nidulans FGSC A4]EAA61431.1 hypothetical protein AN7179.2 [Aspergillus nidulans FGSC A4]CBF78919.1 TPA: conserved hypothetical protein [Aspergillus nidulans FGSC A4]|eukprot:XP_664783.1 hypothetical protein AN7179.2 [Aspergillus nidulans FGSC A4]